MPRDDRELTSIRLSTMAAGLNRFDSEASRDQYVDGINVVNDNGDLRRRDAFKTIAGAPPHFHPAGCVVVKTSVDGVVFVSHPDRDPPSVEGYIYVGNFRTNGEVGEPQVWGQFSGVDFGAVTTDVTGVNGHFRLSPQYWNGSAWTAIPSFTDETIGRAETGISSLVRSGRIFWHLPQFSSSWSKATIDSTSALWVRFLVHAVGSTTPIEIPFANFIIAQPGIRIFSMAPVNGLFSVRVRNKQSLVIGSDRSDRKLSGLSIRDDEYSAVYASGFEQGAQLGAKKQAKSSTEILKLLVDEGAGSYGLVAWPRAQRNGVNVGTAGLTYGTLGMIEKLRTEFWDAPNQRYVPYVWSLNGFRGGRVSDDLQRAGGTTSAILRVTASGSGLTAQSGFYRHGRIVCTTSGGGGVTLSEESEIYDHVYDGTTHFFYLNPAFGATPVAADRFRIYRPHAVCTFSGRRGDHEIINNGEHTLELSDGKNYTPAASDIGSIPVHFRIGRELRWTSVHGLAWSGVVDPVTGDLILTNGSTGLLEFDGADLRPLKADVSGPQALRIAGELPDEVKNGQTAPRAIALSALRRAPPPGKYVAVHRNRLFVAGFAGEPYTVKWSAVGGANNVWPYVNEGLVRDAEEDPVTGMISLGDRLIVFTPTSLHEVIDIGSSPWFDLVPIAKGVGFAGQNAAASYIQAGTERLIGACPGGIVRYSAGEPDWALDDWRRLFRNGINSQVLNRACVVSLPQASAVVYAVAESGSPTNNRLIWHDTHREQFHVWTAPFGVSSLAVGYDGAGREKLLVGTDDGHVMTLIDAETDDGSEIDGHAVTPVVASGNGYELALCELLITAKTTGAVAAQQMEIDVMSGDNIDQPIQDCVLTVSRGEPIYNSAGGAQYTLTSAATAASPRYQQRQFVTLKLKMRNSARAHRFAVKVGGSCRWVFKSAEMLVKPLARKGRR